MIGQIPHFPEQTALCHPQLEWEMLLGQHNSCTWALDYSLQSRWIAGSSWQRGVEKEIKPNLRWLLNSKIEEQAQPILFMPLSFALLLENRRNTLYFTWTIAPHPSLGQLIPTSHPWQSQDSAVKLSSSGAALELLYALTRWVPWSWPCSAQHPTRLLWGQQRP